MNHYPYILPACQAERWDLTTGPAATGGPPAPPGTPRGALGLSLPRVLDRAILSPTFGARTGSV